MTDRAAYPLRVSIQLAVRHQPNLAVLLPEPLEHLRGHPGEVGKAPSPRVEDVDVVLVAVAERGQDVVDAACPAVGLDALADLLGERLALVDLAVTALAEDVEAGADRGPVV